MTAAADAHDCSVQGKGERARAIDIGTRLLRSEEEITVFHVVATRALKRRYSELSCGRTFDSEIEGALRSRSRFTSSFSEAEFSVGGRVEMNRDSNDKQAVKLSGEEVAQHNSRESCWVIVHGKGRSRSDLGNLHGRHGE
nr:hypothetical protein CFP56_21856 [Quercus suber]